ncbi:conserved hypothetical protein [Perkinsus marinus ATCC 50983]|uniref:Mandelate racemase/muconate lactonizing enzyme C-terminal domain-containing protein n=1 Tax=Perkinsus marinus (strain ATCC 50983 / TXsc) TaxID=423536 RepID=C5L708_PERM5|nr:conserved hypothetical protein [Perkinsus marinus ATCC 50983]EER07270.1 conserved hypothetical protein [Perkinsus marinus ATCC 50983]|eukprot:XP_002775454.1 conserved hypothetical protein [Perkinsus marinus ATCC 50983]
MEPIPIPRSIDLTADAVYEASRIASSGDISLQGAVEMALLGCVCECIGKRPAEVLSWYGGANGREISQVVKINQMYTREENQGGAQLRGCVKLKVGENPIRDAEKVNSAASGLVGTARLRLDANQSWTPDEYHTFATSLSESTKAKIEYIEEPTVTWNDDLIRLGIPTAMDESLATAKSFPACERTDVYFVLKPGVIGWRRACQYVASYPHRCCLSSMFESSLAMYWCTALASLCGDGVYHGLSTSGRVIEPRKRTYEDITRKSEGQWFVNVHDCEEELKTITAALVRENDDFSIF